MPDSASSTSQMQAVWVIAFLILTFLTAKWKIARIRRPANRLKYWLCVWFEGVDQFTHANGLATIRSFGERIGLIIAHPDDECMFFSPTLVENSDADWFVLCLSKGSVLICLSSGVRAPQLTSMRRRQRVRTWEHQGERINCQLCTVGYPV